MAASHGRQAQQWQASTPCRGPSMLALNPQSCQLPEPTPNVPQAPALPTCADRGRPCAPGLPAPAAARCRRAGWRAWRWCRRGTARCWRRQTAAPAGQQRAAGSGAWSREGRPAAAAPLLSAGAITAPYPCRQAWHCMQRQSHGPPYPRPHLALQASDEEVPALLVHHLRQGDGRETRRAGIEATACHAEI